MEINLPVNFEIRDYDRFQVLKEEVLRKYGWDTIFITTDLTIKGDIWGTEKCGPVYCCLKNVREGNTIIVDQLDFLEQDIEIGETAEQIKNRLIAREMFYETTFPILIKSIIVNRRDLGPFLLEMV